MDLTSWQFVLGIGAVYIATLFGVRSIATNAIDNVRRLTLFFLIYIASVAIYALGQQQLWFSNIATVKHITIFLGWLTLIDLFAILFFKLLLPRFGLRPASIVGDLFVGIAIIVLVVITLKNFGVDTTGIFATSAVITAILAIGLQATLGNVIGGIALQLDRSVRVGDWIELENGKQGKVQEIRWRHTVIQTRDWDTIIVPNSSLLAANITILGKRVGEPLQHRMWIYFNVDFRTRPSQVIEIAEAALQAAPPMKGVALQPKPNCICADFAGDNRESYALYAVRYWLTDIAEDDPTNSLVRQRLYAALNRANIPLAIPAAHYFIDNNNRERRQRKLEKDLQYRKNALSTVSFLRMLNDDELDHLAKGLQPVLFSKNENIMVQGMQSDWLYIQIEGEVEVKVNIGGVNKVVSTLSAPTFFGEMGLMTGEPRNATITATTSVKCFRLYRDGFKKVLHERPEIIEEISSILLDRDHETQQAKEMLGEEIAKRKSEKTSGQLFNKISTFFGLSH